MSKTARPTIAPRARPTMAPRARPTMAHRAEALAVRAMLWLFRRLSLEAASRLGGWVARRAGPLIPVSKVGHRNLMLAMPELSAARRREIIAETWENLGRTAAELARIGDLHQTASGPGYIVTGWEENVAPAIAGGGPAIFFTAHLGNWEIIPAAAFSRGVDLGFLYRAASNPLVDDIILRLREANFGRKMAMFPKGGSGARGAYKFMAQGGRLAILVDQKLDNGISVPLFGREAMTAPSMAVFAMKFRCPVLPVHVVRIGPARLQVICDPPMEIADTGDKDADVRTMTEAMNRTLERWIRAAPGDWLWLHRRWPKPLYTTGRKN